MNTATTFNHSEEAFLLGSLQEVVKVWIRGNGQASFNLNIVDGLADLNLSFKLGNPAEPHCHPYPPPSHQCYEPVQPQNVEHHRRRRRRPGRRLRDQERAAKYHLYRQTNSAADSGTVSAAKPAVILPFTGKLIQLKKDDGESNDTVDSLLNYSPPASVPPTIAITPTKLTPAVNSTHLQHIDANLVRKHLFDVAKQKPPIEPSSTKPIPRTSPSKSPPPKLHETQTYRKKEEELWSKLFS